MAIGYCMYLVCLLLCASRSLRASDSCSGHNGIRLVESTDLYSGQVQLFFNGTWMYIVSRYWTPKLADIACRQLGFSKSVNSFWTFKHSHGNWVVQGDFSSCPGNAISLLNCSKGSYTASLVHFFPVATTVCEVDCGEPPHGVKSTVSKVNTTLGSTANYTCLPNTRYLSGNATLSC
eukprot:scpid103106/ scgid28333/ Neurotrypsin; Serine protease 12